jgi:hypothetical protein
VRPILDGRADIVVGDRKPAENTEFSPVKRLLQKVGSGVVRKLATVDITDAVSGFRAYSRDAAMRMTVVTKFSYTTETLIAAGNSGMAIVSVPVKTHAVERPSRLFNSIAGFVFRQMVTILRSFVMYRPLRAFMYLGFVMMGLGMIPVIRFLIFWAQGNSDGHIQSLVLGGALLVCGYVTFLVALLSDVVATNRRLAEEIVVILRRMEYTRK